MKPPAFTGCVALLVGLCFASSSLRLLRVCWFWFRFLRFLCFRLSSVFLVSALVVVVVVVPLACGFCNRRGRAPRRFTRARRPVP